MENYIKTIINGLKAWVTSEIELLKNTIARMIETLSADTDEQCKSIKDEVAKNTAKVEALSNLQVVQCDIVDTGGPASTYIDNWETIDREAPFIIFIDIADANNTVLGFYDQNTKMYYGMTHKGRLAQFSFVGNDTVYCIGGDANYPARTLVGAQVVDNLDKKPSTNQPYVLSANQGYELQKQITALTERVEALEQEVTT